MILNNLEDYCKHKLLIPVCEESDTLDRAIQKYEELRKYKGTQTPKRIEDLSQALKNVKFQMGRLRKVLEGKGMWG